MHPTLPSKSSVLIVEDEFITIKTLKLMLQKDGYKVCGYAFSVAEALPMIEAQQPDVVLLDIYLQGEQTGIDLAHHLDRQNIPFIFISAYSNANLIEEAKATRPYGYLVKPFREQDVLVTLEIAHFRHQNNRELTIQKEQNLLLRLGQEYAYVQTKVDLFKALHRAVKGAIPLEDMLLTLWNEELKTYSLLHWNEQQPDTYQELTENQLIGTDSYWAWLSELTEITFLQAADWLHFFPTCTKATVLEGQGNTESVVMPLRKTGALLGGLALYSRKSGSLHNWRKELFQGLGDQVAGTLANLNAREEKKQREQEDALRLKLVSTLSEAIDWEQKLLNMAKIIQQFVPFDFIVLGLNQEKSANPHCAFFRIGFEEYQIIQVVDLLSMLGINTEQYGSLLREMAHQEAAIWQEEAFRSICQQYRIKGLLAKKFNLQSNITLPLPMARGGVFACSLYSRQPDVYSPEHLALLERLRPSLILTLDRLLALGELDVLTQLLGKGLQALPPTESTESPLEGIIGRSDALKNVFELTRQVAPVNTTVLILGESGTGKELFAKVIHQRSPRSQKPFIKVNCAAIPANLIESELFGHEKGAFTGASERRMGKFELANGGTLLLDEVGEMPLELQVKLLRVLQEKEIERIGGKAPIKVDVRILAATNRDLKTEVAEGRFRLDLYYRLNVFPLTLPPLRERKNDIPLLAAHFAQKFCQQMGKPFHGIAANTMDEFQNYSWPGNIRELENLMERAVILHNGHAPLEWEGFFDTDLSIGQSDEKTISSPKPQTQWDVKQRQQEVEREKILSILEQTGGRIRGNGGAAALLNIKPTTLEARMEKLGIKK